MFTQVYFHKTRVAYDHHFHEAMGSILGGQPFPPPTAAGIEEYLAWNDWRVLGRLADGKGGEHGHRLCDRDHYRQVYHTPEMALDADHILLTVIENSLGTLVAANKSSKTSTYKLQAADISVLSADGGGRVMPLSHHSCVVRDLNKYSLEIVRLYSTPENAAVARAKVAALQEKLK